MIPMTKHYKNTTIQLTIETRNELKEMGTKGETYDEIIKRLITAYKRWEEKD